MMAESEIDLGVGDDWRQDTKYYQNHEHIKSNGVEIVYPKLYSCC